MKISKKYKPGQLVSFKYENGIKTEIVVNFNKNKSKNHLKFFNDAKKANKNKTIVFISVDRDIKKIGVLRVSNIIKNVKNLNTIE